MQQAIFGKHLFFFETPKTRMLTSSKCYKHSSRKLIIMSSSYKLGGSNYFCATDITGVGLDVIYAMLPIRTANTQNSKRATHVTSLRNFLAANAQNNKHSFVQPYFQ